MPVRSKGTSGRHAIFKVVLISAGIVGFGIMGIVSFHPNAARSTALSDLTASRFQAAEPHPVYFAPSFHAAFVGLFKNRSVFALPYMGASDSFSVKVISSTEGMATWVFPKMVNSGTPVVLWEYPNVLPPVASSDTRFQIGSARVNSGQNADAVSIKFPLPPGWPNIHATFMMELLPKHVSTPFYSPPLGQLPEVPWAAGLPMVGVVVVGYALRRSAMRANSST